MAPHSDGRPAAAGLSRGVQRHSGRTDTGSNHAMGLAWSGVGVIWICRLASSLLLPAGCCSKCRPEACPCVVLLTI